ncbi:integrase catalytic domain-containing protein [Trichonephila clavipes]|nr:integrase catalytic domain-containing protein [Trichonephila clavipes]
MEEWMNFYQKLAKVNNFKIPRCILLPATIRIEIHGFSDASERAYAAVVYIKCFNESGQSQTRLLCSKSRVAPLKTLTIPRLELSAALLLSRLVKKVAPILQLSIHKIWMWTDSTIALAWIKTEPHKLKTFVSNRVAEIQALSKDYHWKHVSSKNNPADLISRGCNVDELLKNEMWFSGPDLQTDEYEDNQLFPDPSYRDELKCAVTLSMTECSSNFYDELFNVTNNFIKLIRIFGFIFRFINNIKAKESCNKEKYLTAYEVKRSTEFLAKIAQLSEFKAEIDALKKGKGVSKTSKLKALDPFLDENSLLRVGGRLCNADLPFKAKHQIIIPIPLSDNINEYEVLTPGHFIIGRPISAIPEPAILDISDNRLSRWQYTTKCVQTIWKRWKNDYLNHLQQRNKWQFEKNNVAVGCLVLLKENDLPPCKWTMARILRLFMELTVSHDDIDELLVDDALSDNDIIDLTLDLTVDGVVGLEGDNDEEEKSTPLTGKLIQEGLQLCSKLENHFFINEPNSERASKLQRVLQNCIKGRATQNENEVCENPWPLPQISIAETVSSDDEGDLEPLHKRCKPLSDSDND